MPDVDRVALKALAKSPADRYPTATALAAALDQALDVTHSGARPVIPSAGPAPLQVLGLFCLAGAAVLAMAYALVRQVGLPQWMFLLAILLMVVGLPIMLLGARGGPGHTGLRRFLTLRNGLVGGVLAFTAWGVLAALLVLRSPAVAGATPQGRRLVVLPFTNRGAPEDAYFADGIADEVRGKLAGLGTVQLIARSSSDQYRESPKSPQADRRRAWTSTTCSPRPCAGPRPPTAPAESRWCPELIDARTGDVTWQQSFDANLTDVFQVQTQIASRVAGALGVALGSREATKLGERPTENLAAYDLVPERTSRHRFESRQPPPGRRHSMNRRLPWTPRSPRRGPG